MPDNAGDVLPFFLVEIRVDGDAGERTFAQEFVELDRTSNRLDEDNDLVVQISGPTANSEGKKVRTWLKSRVSNRSLSLRFFCDSSSLR